MKKLLISLLAAGVLMGVVPMSQWVEAESHDHDHDHGEKGHSHDSFSADVHHNHGTLRANFIPTNILNPDDSVYQAPQATADYVGSYTGQVYIEDLDADLKILATIQADGLLNLAYYFINPEDRVGMRFYADEEGVIQERETVYQDLVVMTAALREGEGGLGTGLIGKTVSPIVLLDESGQVERLYPYMALAFDLREAYKNARVYQNISLYATDGKVTVDVNHLIGLESDDKIAVQLEKVDDLNEDAMLVDQPTYELLQSSFDHDLDADHNDFKLNYESANDFVQRVMGMHLRTNTSFSADIRAEMLGGESVALDESLGAGEVTYAFLLNDAILYAYDGHRLYMAEEVKVVDGVYSSNQWTVSH